MNIAIDVDEVLSDSLNKIIEFHNEKYGTSLIKDQFKMWGYHNVWGGTIEEEAKKLAAFYETESFREMKPINGSVEGVKKLSSSNDLYVITSRPVQVLDETKRWLKQYYQDAFTEVICTNNWAKNGKKTTKNAVCEELKIDVLIEDSVEYARECANANRQVLLLDYLWNQAELPKEITRVYSWQEIVEKVNG